MRALLAAALALAIAGPAAAATGNRHVVPVSAMVMVSMKLKLHDHPGTLQVSAADRQRGYVVVTGPRIEAGTNHRSSTMSLQVRLDPGVASEMWIDGLSSGVHAQGEHATVALPPALPTEPARAVTYRFALAGDVVPGTYPWPVSLSMQGHP